MLNSNNIPDVTYSPDITDIFKNFAYNWDTLSPATFLLYGTLFGFFVLGILLKAYRGE